jgi:hypothetical protein
VAAFARQTGLDCTSCHASVGFPTLNTFGQSFKAGGYINGDDANMMGDGEALSIPKALNASLVVKVMGIHSTTEYTGVGAKATTDNGLAMPDEFAILYGGRVSKNVGYLIEWGGINADGETATGGDPNGALSFKMPFVFDLVGGKLGVVPFWTDGLGVGYGFEEMSTGAVRNIRAVESRKTASAANYVSDVIGDGIAGGASGITAYYWMGIAHVAVTGFAPASTQAIGGAVSNVVFANYIRAVVTPSVAGLDIAVGVQKSLGTPHVDGVPFNEQNFLGVDAQVMGNLGLPVALFVTYGQGDDLTNSAGKAQAGTEASAITVLGDVQLIENTLNLAAGVRLGTIKDVNAAGATTAAERDYSDNALVVEAKYNLARNVRFSVDYNMELGDVLSNTATKNDAPADRTSMARVMLFAGF